MWADQFCKYDERYNPHTYTFTGKCVFSEVTYSVTVSAEDLYKFRQTGQISSFSNPAEEREFLMSGISPTGWAMLSTDDDESTDEALTPEEEELEWYKSMNLVNEREDHE